MMELSIRSGQAYRLAADRDRPIPTRSHGDAGPGGSLSLCPVEESYETSIVDAQGSTLFTGDLMECNGFLNGFLKTWPATVILSESASLGPYTPAVRGKLAQWAVLDLQGDVLQISGDPVELFGWQWQVML